MDSERQLADRAAFRLIMGKPTAKNIQSFALGLSLEGCEGATNTFHGQGPGLWGRWSRAMNARIKAGLEVPACFRS